MADPTYLVTSGPRETIGSIESKLLARGFNRSPGDRSSGQLMPLQYRCWKSIESGGGEFVRRHTATLFWREEDWPIRDAAEH